MNRTEKTLVSALILLIIVGVGVFVLGQSNTNKDSNEIIKIGILAPLSGPVARFGEWTVRGAQVALKEINHRGGVLGKSLEIVVEDDQCNSSKAVSAVNKLQDIDDINILISYCALVSPAITPIAKDRSVIFAPTFKIKKLENVSSSHYIAMQPSTDFEISRLFKYLKDQNVKDIGMFYTTNDFWTSYRDSFVASAENNDMNISIIEPVDFKQNDFRTQLSKMKGRRPDVIFGGLNPGPLGNMMRQKDELLIDIPVVGIWGTQAPDLINTGGSAVNGIVYTYYYEDGFTKRNERYMESYTARYNEEPELISASTYDAIFIIKHIVEICGEENLECMIEETNKIKDYEGASGIITFSNGTTIKDVFLKTVKDREFVLY